MHRLFLRLDPAAAAGDEDDRLGPRVDHRVRGHPQPVARLAVEDHLAEHLGAQQAARVREGEARPGRARPRIEERIDEEDPADFVPVEKQPVPVKSVQPEYPEIARRASVEGTVWVKILVDKEGKAKKAVVMKSDAEIFNDPSIKAALQWVFTPAMMNNGPVAVWAMVPFHFKLNK